MPSRRGRPPLDADDVSVRVTVAMTSRQYDSVWEQAQRERVTVPEVMRRLLAERTQQPQDDDTD